MIDAVDPKAWSSFLQISRRGLQVDHELCCAMSSSLLAPRYETDNFSRGACHAPTRRSHDRVASAAHLPAQPPHLGVTATYSFLNEASSGAARIPGYRQNVVSISLVVQQ